MKILKLNLNLLILFILIIATKFVVAQNPIFKQLSTAQNFPSDEIYDIYQSKSGVLWIASGDGLIRYSGSLIDLYIPQNATSRGVSNIMAGANGKFGVRIFRVNFFICNRIV